jgi:CDP-diacylglycerol--glycerol-3-phosphate 3-phosphatidyltransferase
MGIYSVKPRFQRALHGAETFFVRAGVHPDQLTLSALLLSVLGAAALAASGSAPWLLLLVPPVAVGRTALNALDGLVAKRTGLARPWGEVLNETSDRVSDVALFAGVALAPGSDALLGVATLVLMLLSSYVGTVAKAAGGRRQYGGVMGKADRMIWLSLASVAGFLLPGVPVFRYFLVAVLVGLGLTIAQRLRAAYVDLQPGR